MIDYDLRLIRGFVFDIDGVLSPSTIAIGDDGYPRRMANIKDGFALQLAARKGYPIAVISGGRGDDITKRCNALGIKDIFTDCGNKLPVLKQWMATTGLQRNEIVYMGDDIPDLECMAYAGLSCTPADGCREAKERAVYISELSGGYGCVRDIIEQVLRAREDWLKEYDHIW